MILISNKPKVLNQCVDTLHIGIRITNEDVYNHSFNKLKQFLASLKSDAKEINTFGEKFVKSDLNLRFGIFKVFSRGIRNYFATFANDDTFYKISNASFDSKNIYHIEVEFRSEFLLKCGHIRAYEYVIDFLNSFLYSQDNYDVYVTRIDLATDITGIRYVANDTTRFRTLKKVGLYSDEIKVYLSDEKK